MNRGWAGTATNILDVTINIDSVRPIFGSLMAAKLPNVGKSKMHRVLIQTRFTPSTKRS
jgi:hypothetical protein